MCTFRTFASTSTSSPAGMPARYVVWRAMLTPGRLLMVTSAADPTVSTIVAEHPPCSVEFLVHRKCRAVSAGAPWHVAAAVSMWVTKVTSVIS